MKKVFLLSFFLFLGGCALPLPFQIASWVADGVSYIATNKSITDHGISMVMNRDCSLLHIITRGEICSDEDYIGFAAMFRDFNGPAPTVSAITSTLSSDVSTANDNIAEIISNSGVDMKRTGFVVASGLSDNKSGRTSECVAKLDVNVRTEPRETADIKTVLLRNESVKCLGEKYGWRMIELATNAGGKATYGWVDGGYLELYRGSLFL